MLACKAIVPWSARSGWRAALADPPGALAVPLLSSELAQLAQPLKGSAVCAGQLRLGRTGGDSPLT